MEVQEFDLVEQLMLFEQVDSRQKFRNFQAKLRITTAGGRPFSRALCGELNPDTELRYDTDFLLQGDNLLQLK